MARREEKIRGEKEWCRKWAGQKWRALRTDDGEEERGCEKVNGKCLERKRVQYNKGS